MRVGSFNVENLFDRAKALDPRNRKKVAPVLNAYSELNQLFEHTTYTAEDKTRMVELLRTLGLGGKDDGGTYAQLRQNRGRLLNRAKGKIEIVADGRASWIRWVELKMAPVNQVATQNTAQVMHDVGADVLAVVEADDRPALIKFEEILFKRIHAAPYAHVMLIDGNDDRGIDVALLTEGDYPIARIRSHVDDRDDRGVIFSRDCPEYTVETPAGERIVFLVNHLKSKGYGKPAESNARRERQAHRVAEIYARLVADGDENIVVLGDFNDFPDSPPLAPLLAQTDLRDVSTHDRLHPLLARPLGPRHRWRHLPQRRVGWQERHDVGALPDGPLGGASGKRPLGDLCRPRPVATRSRGTAADGFHCRGLRGAVRMNWGSDYCQEQSAVLAYSSAPPALLHAREQTFGAQSR